jgi:hypothetical protein
MGTRRRCGNAGVIVAEVLRGLTWSVWTPKHAVQHAAPA